MNFTAMTMVALAAWSNAQHIDVDVHLDFSGKFNGLVFSFSEPSTCKVWSKTYDGDFLASCGRSLFQLTRETLEEAEEFFKEGVK